MNYNSIENLNENDILQLYDDYIENFDKSAYCPCYFSEYGEYMFIAYLEIPSGEGDCMKLDNGSLCLTNVYNNGSRRSYDYYVYFANPMENWLTDWWVVQCNEALNQRPNK